MAELAIAERRSTTPFVSPEKLSALPPTPLACLRCQLVGRRRLLCSKADACKELPLVFAVGPLLLGGWFAFAIVCLLTMW
jgi:hypothetical protein